MVLKSTVVVCIHPSNTMNFHVHGEVNDLINTIPMPF